MRNLTVLDVSYNQLAYLPAEIGMLTKLRSLYASNNMLVTLPLEITELHYLSYLDVHRNQIEYIPYEIFQMPGLYISYWGNPGYGGYYYYNDDGFIDFIGGLAEAVYFVFSNGWNLSASLDYQDHLFSAHLSERAVRDGFEHLTVVGTGDFRKQGTKDW